MAKKSKAKSNGEHEFIPCSILELPDSDTVAAAEQAVKINPVNAPDVTRILALFATAIQEGRLKKEEVTSPQFLASITTKYWGTGGVKLTVGFLEPTSIELRNKFLQYMNLWNAKGANVNFVYSNTDPQVRITREQSGYWSYLGTDILRINRSQPTMCFQGFTINTPDSEWMRVVPHEAGHTLSFPHEHLRQEIVNRLDPARTLAYFKQTQGWSAATTKANVLEPIDPSTITATPTAQETSIMAYRLPGAITKDGKPIEGGTNITDMDYQFVATLFPGSVVVEPPPPPTGSTGLHLDIEFETPVPKIKGYTIK